MARVGIPARILRCLLLCALGLALATASPAAAAARLGMRLPGPSFLTTGFADDNVFQLPDTTGRDAWFWRAELLGSGWVRIGVYWSMIAPAHPLTAAEAADPSNPAYDFSDLDSAIRSAATYRQRVLLTIFHPPAWALGRGQPRHAIPLTWRPQATAVGAFAHALALRYSGQFPDPAEPGQTLPRVSSFQAWNEPNLPTSISPQWQRGRHGHWVPASPGIYRAILNAVYAGVKAVQPHATVFAAGLAPYGDPPGVNRMSPVPFLRALLCLRGPRLVRVRCGELPHFDAFDHHPYALTPNVHAFSPDDVSLPDIGRLAALLRAAERRRTVRPLGPKPIWVTEIDWTSNPPDPFGISLGLQARFLSLAFYVLWRQGISHVLWFLIRDAPYKSLAGAGVYFGDGTPKPSAAAFFFPFVAITGFGPHPWVTIWGRAPAAGTVVVEGLVHHAWAPVLSLRTTRQGIFYTRRRIMPRAQFRAQEGRWFSVAWRRRR